MSLKVPTYVGYQIQRMISTDYRFGPDPVWSLSDRVQFMYCGQDSKGQWMPIYTREWEFKQNLQAWQ